MSQGTGFYYHEYPGYILNSSEVLLSTFLPRHQYLFCSFPVFPFSPIFVFPYSILLSSILFLVMFPVPKRERVWYGKGEGSREGGERRHGRESRRREGRQEGRAVPGVKGEDRGEVHQNHLKWKIRCQQQQGGQEKEGCVFEGSIADLNELSSVTACACSSLVSVHPLAVPGSSYRLCLP